MQAFRAGTWLKPSTWYRLSRQHAAALRRSFVQPIPVCPLACVRADDEKATVAVSYVGFSCATRKLPLKGTNLVGIQSLDGRQEDILKAQLTCYGPDGGARTKLTTSSRQRKVRETELGYGKHQR